MPNREEPNAEESVNDVEAPRPMRPEGHPKDLAWPPKWREYPEDHPARRDEESKEAFNEDWARADFGDEFVDQLKHKQRKFRGDWWLLALLVRCAEAAIRSDPEGSDPKRFGPWNEACQRCSKARVHVHLEHANLWLAHLEHADLRYAHLEHTDLGRAHLEHAHLEAAHLEHAYLLFAHLEHADLRSAHLEHADLDGARLDHADVRDAQGLLFDNNPVDRLHIEGRARDPWSQLRREYTGPRFFFHLLLLVAFLLPFAARVLHLSALAEVHESAERIISHADAALAADAPNASTVSAVARQAGMEIASDASPERIWNLAWDAGWDAATRDGQTRALEWIKDLKAQYEATHTEAPAVWVLIGGAKGWYFVVLTFVLILYNALRLLLTSRVSALRDAEERAKVTPALKDYYGVCHPIADRDELLTGEQSDPRRPPRRRDMPRIWWRRAGEWLRAEHKPWPAHYSPDQRQSVETARAWRWRRLDLLDPLEVMGLYRLHNLARVIFWAAIISFGINSAIWTWTTRVRVPNPSAASVQAEYLGEESP